MSLTLSRIVSYMVSQWDKEFQVRLTLQARSEEADSNLVKTEIIWNGKWDDDEGRMAENLIVQEV